LILWQFGEEYRR